LARDDASFGLFRFGSWRACTIDDRTGAFTTLLHRPFVKCMKIPLHDTPVSSSAVSLCEHDVQVARIRKQKRRVDNVYTLIA
jgi:hypothetical protein